MTDIREFAKHLIESQNTKIDKLRKVLKDEYGIEPKKQKLIKPPQNKNLK